MISAGLDKLEKDIRTSKIILLLSISATAFFASTNATARSIELDCFTVVENLPRETFSVSLDERKGQVKHAGPQGSFSAIGFFGPNQISYQKLDPENFGFNTFRKYVINRKTLQITEFVTIQAASTTNSTSQISTGSCTVTQNDAGLIFQANQSLSSISRAFLNASTASS